MDKNVAAEKRAERNRTIKSIVILFAIFYVLVRGCSDNVDYVFFKEFVGKEVVFKQKMLYSVKNMDSRDSKLFGTNISLESEEFKEYGCLVSLPTDDLGCYPIQPGTIFVIDRYLCHEQGFLVQMFQDNHLFAILSDRDGKKYSIRAGTIRRNDFVDISDEEYADFHENSWTC